MLKQIEGFDRYFINSSGVIQYKSSNKLKILKPRLNKDGYVIARLCKNGKRKDYLVHRLVAIAFIPNPENKPIVNHIDSDRSNNRLYNLEWNTAKENWNHACEYGFGIPREYNPISKKWEIIDFN